MKASRADSTESAVKAMLNAAKDMPAVPAHCKLRECDLPFWHGVLCARAIDEWTNADLVVATQLARCQADIELESWRLFGEGTVLTNARGTDVMNPRVTVLEQLARREMALMRSLRMCGRVLGKADNLTGRRKIERVARCIREELGDDELLA